MSFVDDEKSVSSNRPREFYKIVQSAAVTYYIASGQRDIVYGGNTYVATPAARTEVSVQMPGTDSGDMSLALPLSHGLPQRYSALGVPPRQVSVTVYRKQLESGEVEQIWDGYVTSMAIAGHLAKFLIPSKTSRSMQRRIPSVLAGKLCPYVLYDQSCLVAGESVRVRATVVLHDGRNITLDALGGQPDQWAQFGNLVHVPTGEMMTIFDQTGLVIQMQAPIPDIKTGDLVDVFPGCDHTITTCRDKFANVVHFGNPPNMPDKPVFLLRTGYGVVEQS